MIVIITLGWSIWYHIPLKYERYYEVNTLKEESASLKVNITHIRTFFTKDIIFGKIELSGKSYKSIKTNGDSDYPWFIDEGFRGAASDAEKLIILRENKSFKEISFLHVGSKKSSANHYYGPAKSSKEADIIAKKFMEN